MRIRVIILSPMYIIYRNSEIGISDSDFWTRNHNLFSDNFPTAICGIPGSEAEIPIPDPPARGAVPAEFTTKLRGSELRMGKCCRVQGVSYARWVDVYVEIDHALCNANGETCAAGIGPRILNYFFSSIIFP